MLKVDMWRPRNRVDEWAELRPETGLLYISTISAVAESEARPPPHPPFFKVGVPYSLAWDFGRANSQIHRFD